MVATTAGDDDGDGAGDRIVEIVSCRNLLVGDKLSKSSDPYVKVKTAAGKDVHETQHILKTLDPFYSIEHDSLFHVSAALLDGQLVLKVKDWDRMSSDELGTVEVPPGLLKDATGEAVELHLEPPSKKKGKDAGYVTIRCRPSSAYVDTFAQHLRSGKKSSDFPVQGSVDTLLKRHGTAVADTAGDQNKATGGGKVAEAVDRSKGVHEDKAGAVASDSASEPGLEQEPNGERGAGAVAAAVDVLVEIVSCRDLLVGDSMSKTSDPYAKVKLAASGESGDYLHETQHVLKTLNPEFTVKTDSLFRLSMTEKELVDAGGLLFKIKDWDRAGSNDDLGTVQVPPRVFKEASGLNMEFKLTPPSGKEGKDAGFVTIRCQPTTDHDEKLLQHLKEGKKSSDFPGIETYNLLRTSDHVTAGKTRDMPGDTPEEVEEKKKTPVPGEHLDLLIEIVSCWSLLKGDMTTSDPYVKIYFKGDNVHQTKHVDSTLDPVFTVKQDALFILSMPAKELFDYSGLLFKVKDHDEIGVSGDELGSVQVPAQTIYEGSGERMEFKLNPPSGKKGKDAGYIAIRFRPATNYDKEFLDNLKEGKDSKDFLGIKSSMDKVFKSSGGKGKKFMQSNSKEEHGVKKYRIRPMPDPENESESKWMSNEEINEEVMKPSRKWLDVGTGNLGKVFVEVIGADGLPNKDTAGLSSNKTDSFVALVYEDCMAKTDVIDDCLSPRWLPWMQRAFVFRMMHSSSQLFLGIFDCDLGFANDHDCIGRVAVSLSNLRPGTDYILAYNIYESARMPDARSSNKGTVTIRLRLEIEDEQHHLLSNLEMPPDVYVNVKDKEDFYVVKKTVTGKYDTEMYSKKMISQHIEEIRCYRHMLHYIKDAVVNLLFWRGHFPLTIRVPSMSKPEDKKSTSLLDEFTRKVTVYLPIHSLNAFIAGVLMVERPRLIPSFFFFGFAWFLLAVMGYRRKNPNPWDRCKSFPELLQVMILGFSLTPPDSIAQHENEAEAKAFAEKWEQRIAKAEEDAAKAYEKMLKEQEEYEKEMEEIGETTADTDISTKTDGGTSLDPFKPILFPIQGYLAMACRGLRFVRNVIAWEESYISFFLVVGSLVLGLIFLFVPWAFIIWWTSRLLVWGLLGPWMIAVDVFWYSKKVSEREKKEQEEAAKQAQIDAAKALAVDARAKREEAAKLKDMKSLLYGKFSCKVPIFNVERYRDTPLHTSMAAPCKAELSDVESKSERVVGQRLVGAMIPKVQTSFFFDSDDKAARAKRAGQYIKIFSAVAMLATLAWVCVPRALSLYRGLETPKNNVTNNGAFEL